MALDVFNINSHQRRTSQTLKEVHYTPVKIRSEEIQSHGVSQGRV